MPVLLTAEICLYGQSPFHPPLPFSQQSREDRSRPKAAARVVPWLRARDLPGRLGERLRRVVGSRHPPAVQKSRISGRPHQSSLTWSTPYYCASSKTTTPGNSGTI